MAAAVLAAMAPSPSLADPRPPSDQPGGLTHAIFLPATTPAPAEPSLGVADQGIFSDLDSQLALPLPPGLTRSSTRAVVDTEHALLVVYVTDEATAQPSSSAPKRTSNRTGDWPIKVYPLTGTKPLSVGSLTLMLRPGDHRELAPLLHAGNTLRLAPGTAPAPGDRDGDGIPDPLDLLIGGYKTALNRAGYGAGYIRIPYPMGDVPREVGVCTDVIIRAARNAGLDLQQALHRDIRRARRSYPMVKGNGDTNIDHRRVRTLLPYFQRHWDARSKAIDDPSDPLRPGDIVLMDTFPSRSGPDHIGIVSNRLGESGHPLIINNWTDGTFTTEMDLLGWVPVTHRFRIPSK